MEILRSTSHQSTVSWAAFFILGAWIVQDYGWWFLHLLLYVPIIVHKYEKLLFVSRILLSFFTLVWWFFLPQLLFCFDDRASAEQNVKLFVTHPAMLCWFFLMTCSKPSSVSQKGAFPRSDNHSEDVTYYCSKHSEQMLLRHETWKSFGIYAHSNTPSWNLLKSQFSNFEELDKEMSDRSLKMLR